MARPRQFDEDQAADAAMDVFWKHGYEGASIALLLQGMGMTKGSLYKAFTDKKSLFLTAMARYEAAQVQPAVALLKGTEPGAAPHGRARIEAVFRSVPGAVRAGDRRGCMLCSAAAGPSFEDSEIAALVDQLMGDLRRAFEDACQDFAPADRCAPLARVLLTQYVGLRILARAQTSAEDLDRSVDALLDGLT